MDAVGGMLTAVRTPTDEELTLCEWSLFEHHVSNHHLGRSRIQTSYLHSWIIWGWGVVGVLVKKGSFFWWCAVRAIILLLKWAGGGGAVFRFSKKCGGVKFFQPTPPSGTPGMPWHICNNAHRTRQRAIPKKTLLHEIFFLATWRKKFYTLMDTREFEICKTNFGIKISKN